MKNLTQKLSLLLFLAIVFSSLPSFTKALTYEEIKQSQTGKVLGETHSYPYPSASLVNENGTIYFIRGTFKVPFTNWPAFSGLGYSLNNVVKGGLESYTLSKYDFITTANAPHPWGSWLLYNKIIYYSHESGLIGVPTWEVFLQNGGKPSYVVNANSYDLQILSNKVKLPILTLSDGRVYNNTGDTGSPTNPTPAPVPPSVSTTIDTLDYFLSNHTDTTLSGTHPMSLTVSGQTAHYVKWSTDSYETYIWDSDYIYLKEDHSGSPNPGSYTYSVGKWLKRSMQIGDLVDVSDNRINNFPGLNCTLAESSGYPYQITLEQHNPSYDLGGALGVQDVIIIKYDYPGTDYERSYYSKEWGFVKWELYNGDGNILHSSIFNLISNAPPTAPNLQTSCMNAPVPEAVPTTLNGFVNMLYGCVLQNKNPDSNGFNYWLQNLQTGALDIKGAYNEFYKIQGTLNPPINNDTFTKLAYRCMLFREVDNASYTNVMNGLGNGSLSRSSVVASVLGSPEFNNTILPKLQALTLSSGNVSPIPASLSAFVNHLYLCVLDNSKPDSAGVNYWTQSLQTKALTVQGAYTEFFNFQKNLSPAISNEIFAKKLYACTLFREVDASSYNSITAGLSNGTLSRDGLVQTVLGSSEFTSIILPKLQALIK